MSMTDARIVRTRAALQSSILELASQKPLAEISVSELADRAGINRVTFYKHYASPGDVLTSALDAEIAQAAQRAGRHPKHTDAFMWSVQVVLNHLEEWRDLYTIATQAPIDGTVQLLFATHFQAIAEAYLTKRRKKRPSIPDIDIDVASSYIAAGTTSAIWVWLLEGDVHQERLFENLEHVLPVWFHAEPVVR